MWDNGNRAQTPIDFTVGAGVFLLTLAFVIAFVPTLFRSLLGGGDRLAGGERSRRCRRRRRPASRRRPAEPGVLSPACTVAFLANATLGSEADCHPAIAESPAAHFGSTATCRW